MSSGWSTVFCDMESAPLLGLAGQMSEGTGIEVHWASMAIPDQTLTEGLTLTLLCLQPAATHRQWPPGTGTQPQRIKALLLLVARALTHEDAVRQLLAVISWLGHPASFPPEADARLYQMPTDLTQLAALWPTLSSGPLPFLLLEWEGPCTALPSRNAPEK